MTDILLQIFLAFTVARLLGRLFGRFGQPAVIGELLAGALLGPQILDLVHESEFLEALSGLGVIMLLFMAGVETHVRELYEVKFTAAKVAVLGAVLPFAAGLGVGWLFGFSRDENLFVAVALMATSVGITIRVLQDLGLHKRKSVRIILGAAVLDDILGLFALGIVGAVALGEANVLELGLLAVETVIYVGGILWLGPQLVTRASAALGKISVTVLFEVGVILMLGLSLLADTIGLAAIVGAFLAGLIIAEMRQHTEVEDRFEPLAWFFVPFFFVLMGTYVDLKAFTDPGVLLEIAALSIVAITTKYVGSLLGARRESALVAREVGVGMIPRGEVGIVVAGIALGTGVMSDNIYAAVIGMVLVTTIVGPFLIKLGYGRGGGEDRRGGGEDGRAKPSRRAGHVKPAGGQTRPGETGATQKP